MRGCAWAPTSRHCGPCRGRNCSRRHHCSLLTPAVRGLTTPRVLRPIRDGWLLPEDERPAFQAGRIHAMPLLVGTNLDEGTGLTRSWPIDKLAAWQEQLTGNFGDSAAEAAGLYPAIDDAQARPAVAGMFADTQFNYGARLLAQSMSRVEPRTFKYLFTRRRPGHADGPHHGEETAHVFGNLATGGRYDEVDEALSAAMRRAWVAFARDGDPGVPQWEPYRTGDDNHVVFGDRIGVGSHWRKEQLDFLERFFDGHS
jgi:carboxylesterase type B